MRSLTLVLLFPLIAAAQPTGRLTGTVTDDRGEPLPGAEIIIESTQLGAATDIDGTYHIIGIPTGQHAVTASFVGYRARTDTIEVESRRTTTYDFVLAPFSNEDCVPDSSYRTEDPSWQDRWLPIVHPIAEAYGLAPLHLQSSGPREARMWWNPPWGSARGMVRLVWSEDAVEGDAAVGWPLKASAGQKPAETEAEQRGYWDTRCGPLRRSTAAEACAVTLTEEVEWHTLAEALDEAGLWTLPDETVLPDLYANCEIQYVRMDGETYIVELFDGASYRAYHYWSPNADSSWLEERQAARIAAILRGVYALIPPLER